MSREELLQRTQLLVCEKDGIEDELRALENVLKSQNVGLNDPLVDHEGFPRADLDLYTVRTARNKIIRRKNDLKDIMARIETSLHELHQVTRDSPDDSIKKDTLPAILSKPFARVNAVAPDSPAKEAGLVKDDLIVQFGHLTLTVANENGSSRGSAQDVLSQLPELVVKNENKYVKVVVQRIREASQTTYDTLTLSMRPQKWSGNGLLGCHILPVK